MTTYVVVDTSSDICAWCYQPADARCSRCRSVMYCSKEHQRLHWKSHKAGCFISPVKGLTPEAVAIGVTGTDMASILAAQKQSVQAGTLRITYVNPRRDRTLEQHASDTKPVHKMTPEIARFARDHLDIKDRDGENPIMGMINPNHFMPYGRCHANVMSLVETKGGSAIYGWQLYAGKYVIEAEGHCLWVPPGHDGKKTAVNVTRTYRGEPYSGLFVVSDTAFTEGVGFSPSVMYWKKGK